MLSGSILTRVHVGVLLRLRCVDKASNSTNCAPAYGQCGGDSSYNGTTCCVPGYQCTADPTNPEYYSGCTLIPVCQNAPYGQCGGTDSHNEPWTDDHSTCCPDGASSVLRPCTLQGPSLNTSTCARFVCV